MKILINRHVDMDYYKINTNECFPESMLSALLGLGGRRSRR